MGKHTDGRWEASVTQEFGCEVKANGEDIAWVLSNKPEDAHLMAAAPELLEALEKLQTAAYNIGGEHVTDHQQLIDAADYACQVIKRARGEAQ